MTDQDPAAAGPTGSSADQQQQQQFAIQKVYLKDVSFESPRAPQIFTEQWQADTNLQLNTESQRLNEDHHEVTLTLTVTTKSGEETAYLAEIKQAGIFAVRGFNDEQMGHLLGSYCPSILFPFAREAIAELVSKGGFPQMLLAPMNFDALYAQHLQRQQEQAQEAGSS